MNLVKNKPSAKALLLYCCPNVTSFGIMPCLKIVPSLTVLVLDEIDISHYLMVRISETVKTLKVLSLFSEPRDVSDVSIEAVARENHGIEWCVLPGFGHNEE